MTTLINPVLEKLARDEAVLGTIVTVPSPALVQILAGSGFDWLTFDMEHGPMSIETVHAMINATTPTACVPTVRITTTAPWLAKPVMDAGALGVMFPMVQTPELAADAVAATNYPPVGVRGFAPIYTSYRWNVDMGTYAESANQAVMNILLIEHIEAVNRVDEILAVPGIDVAFVAPYDLSQSLGIPGAFDRPEFQEALARAEKAVLASSAKLGGLAPSNDDGRAMLDRGYRFLSLAYDGQIIDQASRAFIDGVRG
ncbi:MAG: 2,4-dihydroxyhept-2-ene-1,7-dioic acid aldolase [Rhodospirillaceae bacterium]|jgi:4-hydroxy-2-oxoheptanedioate aldolase|nr:2,4-dihydroxyhept-2-ene-1,7-dioic acid aldolase [Rhodospirillaceae bacterium]